jgi:hypothetical protein
MPNHLIHENSPYLLQHANNPVDWYPWGREALEKARTENKPIFLSIGYAACHWCHVMAHESFEDPGTAAVMNRHFVSIKVDREERPDLDSIYMSATQALTGSGGWPMSVFLTPDLRPFYAGTYFPPVQRYNMPSFKELLSSLAEAWREQPAEIERVGANVHQHLQTANSVGRSSQGMMQSDLEAFTKTLLDSYDWGYGGWGSAPKFPQPMLIEFLLLRAVTESPLQEQALKAARHALQAMSRGGMYDVVGGGFARYSTDNFWRVPHFEKMLYDNAQLARANLHAWQITRDPSYKEIVISTLNFVRREMTDAGGAFYSSLDSDTEGIEGKFYVWTADEIRAAIHDQSDYELFAAAYTVTERGNWEGRMVLQRALDNASLASRFKMADAEIVSRLARCHDELLTERRRRTRPATDDKVITAWNGLMLCTFSEAARFLDDEELARDYLGVATRSAEFLLTALRPHGQLRRTWRAGNAGQRAFLDDYAALICGLLELYQVEFNDRWFAAALELAQDMIADFADSQGGFFDVPAGSEELLLRPKDIQDSATPSGNALAGEALLKLASLTGMEEYRDLVQQALLQAVDLIRRVPTAFGRWLNVADCALKPSKQVALVYEAKADDMRDLLAVVNSGFRPHLMLAAASYPPPPRAPALLADRPPKDAKPTAYVCENFVCKLPVNSPEELRQQL